MEDNEGIGNIAAKGIIENAQGTWIQGYACSLRCGSSLLA